MCSVRITHKHETTTASSSVELPERPKNERSTGFSPKDPPVLPQWVSQQVSKLRHSDLLRLVFNGNGLYSHLVSRTYHVDEPRDVKSRASPTTLCARPDNLLPVHSRRFPPKTPPPLHIHSRKVVCQSGHRSSHAVAVGGSVQQRRAISN